MCFAPEADAVAGVVIVAVGVDALRHVGSPKQLALAALPLLFGLHQLTEAFVWWGLQGHVSQSVERIALWMADALIDAAERDATSASPRGRTKSPSAKAKPRQPEGSRAARRTSR